MLDGNRVAFLEKTIQKGDVLLGEFNADGTFRPRNGKSSIKFFVILGVDDFGSYYGVGLINSDPRINFKAADYQFKIKKEDYPFLSHDSYIDCSEIRTRRVDETTDYIAKNEKRILGRLTDDDIERVIAIVISAPTTKPIDLKRFNLL